MTFWKASLFAGAACFMTVPALAETRVEMTAPPASVSPNASSEAAPFGNNAKDRLAELTTMVEDWLGIKELPAIDNTRLIAARTTTAPLASRAGIEKLFDTLYGRIFQSFNARISSSNRELALRGMGVPEDRVATISSEDLDRVLAIINPDMAAQQQHMMATIRPALNAAFDVLQPAIHEGLARGYARRFTAPELAEISAFFSTKVGADFAAEQLALQSNPEVIIAMLYSAPELMNRVEKLLPAMEAGFNAMPKPRDIHDVSDKDIKQIAAILEVKPKTIKAALAAEKAEMKAAEDAAAQAADEVAEIPSYEVHDHYAPTESTPEDITDVTAALNAVNAAAAEAYREANEAAQPATTNASKNLGSTRKP